MERRVRLGAVGDILLHGRYDEIAENQGHNSVFFHFRELVKDEDIVVGNMECVVADGGSPRDDKLCLRADPRYAEALKHAGFTVLSLANNHIFDFGFEGFRETRSRLQKAGILVGGAGENLEEARSSFILDRAGLKFGFLGYSHESTRGFCISGEKSCGVAPLKKDIVLEDIKKIRNQVDHVVLMFHWGIEYSLYPTPEQVELAHSCIDAGARLIIGNHSHVLQGIEKYNNGIIIYSLGNLTDSDVDWNGPLKKYSCKIKDADRETILFRCEFGKDSVAISEFTPLWLGDDGSPAVADASKAAEIRNKVAERSEGLELNSLKSYWENLVISKRVGGAFREWWRGGSFFDKLLNFRPGQIVTLIRLLGVVFITKFSKSERKWELFSPRNDTKPMPSCGEKED